MIDTRRRIQSMQPSFDASSASGNSRALLEKPGSFEKANPRSGQGTARFPHATKFRISFYLKWLHTLISLSALGSSRREDLDETI
jgi:hypothetical protein